MLLSLTSPERSGTDWYALTTLQSGLVVSMSLLGGLFGSLVTLAAGNRLGRRTELLAAAALYGASCKTCIPDTLSVEVVCALLSRAR